MLKDIDGKMFDVGDKIENKEGSQYDVLYIENDKFVTNSHYDYPSWWNIDEIVCAKFHITKKLYLGDDDDGKAVHLGDEINQYKVIGFQKSINDNKMDSFIVKSTACIEGWSTFFTGDSTLTKQLFPDKEESKKKEVDELVDKAMDIIKKIADTVK